MKNAQKAILQMREKYRPEEEKRQIVEVLGYNTAEARNGEVLEANNSFSMANSSSKKRRDLLFTANSGPQNNR